MSTIHLIDGGLGNVGKSMFCKVLVQYCIDYHIPYCLVEADLDNPDVGQVYPERVEQDAQGNWIPFGYGVSFDHPRPRHDPDIILDLAIEQSDRLIIVNLPSTAFSLANRWIEQHDVLDVAQAYPVKFCKWFVTNGRHDSIRLLVQSLDQFGDHIPHVLVLNHYFRRDWSSILDRSGLRQLKAQYTLPIVELPQFSTDYERDYLDEYSIPLRDGVSLPQFTLVQQQRVANFLNTVYRSISQSQILPPIYHQPPTWFREIDQYRTSQ